VTLITPREHAARGSHVSFRHPEGYAVMQALIARGVIGDYREPEVLRFGITPLYVGHADVWDAVEILRDILDTRAWDRPEYFRRAAVT
jgi:kynureninase